MPSVLLDALFWIAVSGCAVAQLFIIRAVLRVVRPSDIAHSASSANRAIPGSDTSDDRPTPAALPVPNQALEVLWAVIPTFLLAVAFVAAWRVMHPTP